MSRLIGTAIVVWVIAALAILSPPSVVKGQVPMTGAGLGAPSGGGGGPFQGSGDIVSGAIMYWSCARAYTASYASGAGNACDIKRTSDSATCTTKFASSGFLDTSTAYCNSNTQNVTAFCNATTCNITKMYDQSGASDCTVACDATNSGGGAGPVLNLSGLSSKACATFSGGATSVLATPSNLGHSQPISGSGVGQVTGATSSNYDLVGTVSGSEQNFLTTTLFSLYAGAGVVSSSVTVDASYHAINSVVNGSSSIIDIDGTVTTGLNPGTNGLAATIVINVGGGNNPYVGNFCEARLDAIAYNSTQYGNLNTNQHGTSGYNF